MKIPYAKKALLFEEQVIQLQNRGLIIDDEIKAQHFLSNINYYRLSAYMYPLLQDKQNHIFKTGSTFNEVLSLYNFDHELRLLVFDAIEKIEISVRTKILYYLSHAYTPFWIEDVSLFANKERQIQHIEKLKDELNRSDEVFLSHYFSKYRESIPPAWISLETASFGLLSQVYKNLKQNKDKKAIASEYKLPEPVFISWLHTITYIRNICAHHSRLWNRELRVAPLIPKSSPFNWLVTPNVKNNRTFFVLAIILYFLEIIERPNDLNKRIYALLDKYPSIDTRAMGFPIDWQNESLFN